MMTTTQIATVEALMRDAAATFIMPRFQSLTAQEIDTKSGPTDLVTIADREAEEWLTPRLLDLLPGSFVVGEEGTAAHPSRLDHLSQDDPVWLVDPVDGTANFVEGSSKFGVMVALVQQGIPLAGFIYAPVEDVMAIALRGQGATLNGQTMQGRKAVGFAQSSGDYSSVYVDPPLRDHLTAAVEGCAQTRSGHCSAYAYLDTARGEIDFVLQYKMSPWDHAAGALMVEEAGGTFRFLDDAEPYTAIARPARAAMAVGDRNMWAPYREALT